jgi:hypothetical protein
MVIYYSDQRDPDHGQKLVHQTSKDLRTWDAPEDDVVYASYRDRPGMTTVAELPNGQFILAYEYGGGPGFRSYSYPLYYRVSDSPLRFSESVGLPIVAGSARPQSSPYVTWTSAGRGKNGSIIVSSGTDRPLFVNQALGDANSWEQHDVPQPTAYSRHLRVLTGDSKGLLMIMGAGHLPPSTTNAVSVGVLDLTELVGRP